MYKIHQTAKSKRDLKQIALHIAKDNPNRAVSFVQELISNFIKKVSIFPYSSSKTGEFYYSNYRKYLIFYKINKKRKAVYILHIVHGARYKAYKNFL